MSSVKDSSLGDVGSVDNILCVRLPLDVIPTYRDYFHLQHTASSGQDRLRTTITCCMKPGNPTGSTDKMSDMSLPVSSGGWSKAAVLELLQPTYHRAPVTSPESASSPASQHLGFITFDLQLQFDLSQSMPWMWKGLSQLWQKYDPYV